MRKRTIASIAVTGLLLFPSNGLCQSLKSASVRASEEAVTAAHKMAEQVFADFKAGETEKIAKSLVAQLGHAWDAQTRIKNMNDFKAKLDMIELSPPAGSYGKLDGYDLLKESFLPGTNRYFRLTYITYHETSVLLWEFRYYVKPDGKPTLLFVSWSENNPFEFLTASEMLIDQWYAAPKF